MSTKIIPHTRDTFPLDAWLFDGSTDKYLMRHPNSILETGIWLQCTFWSWSALASDDCYLRMVTPDNRTPRRIRQEVV